MILFQLQTVSHSCFHSVPAAQHGENNLGSPQRQPHAIIKMNHSLNNLKIWVKALDS